MILGVFLMALSTCFCESKEGSIALTPDAEEEVKTSKS